MQTSRQLFITSICSLFSFTLMALIPRESNPGVLFGFSPVRLGMLAGFLAIALVLGGSGLALFRHPALSSRLWQALQGFLSHPWQRLVLSFTAALVTVIAAYLVLTWLSTTDMQEKATLLRLLPAVLLGGAVAVQFLYLQPLRGALRSWLLAALLALLAGLVNSLLSDWLLAGIDRWYPRDGLIDTLEVAGPLLTMAFALLLAYRILSTQTAELPTWLVLLALTLGLFLLQWFTLPAPYWRAKPYLALSSGALITGWTLFALWAAAWLEDRAASRKEKPAPRSLLLPGSILAILVLGLAALYTVTAVRHAREVNTGISLSDQASYVDFAIQAREKNFRYTGDHNRTPGYPFFQALFYREGMSAAEFWAQGKEINILLSLVLLAGLFLIFRRFLGTLLACLLLLLVAFGLYIFKAPYFQTEILFYSLLFTAYVFLARLLQRPSLSLALSSGIVLGLGHLAKASVMPGLLIFAAVYLLKELVGFIRSRNGHSMDRAPLYRIGLLVLVFAVYLAIIFPYIHAVKQQFGRYFYNVNLTFYVWYDDYFEALEAEEQYHFTQRWPAEIPPEQLPGPAKYFREHTPAQILERIRFGAGEQVKNALSQFGITNYHLSYLLVLIVVVLSAPRRVWKLVRDNPYTVLFGLLFFAGYLASFVWYSPVAPERRFTYTLYLPLLFSIFVALRQILAQGDGRIRVSSVIAPAHLLAALSLVINIWLVVSERMFFDTYGS